jgi:hypothetical protein
MLYASIRPNPGGNRATKSGGLLPMAPTINMIPQVIFLLELEGFFHYAGTFGSNGRKHTGPVYGRGRSALWQPAAQGGKR